MPPSGASHNEDCFDECGRDPACVGFMCECEDIYAKLTKIQPTTRQPTKLGADATAALWSLEPDRTVHNREQGLHANLALLDTFDGLNNQ